MTGMDDKVETVVVINAVVVVDDITVNAIVNIFVNRYSCCCRSCCYCRYYSKCRCCFCRSCHFVTCIEKGAKQFLTTSLIISVVVVIIVDADLVDVVNTN
jgi:hypothetical protein